MADIDPWVAALVDLGVKPDVARGAMRYSWANESSSPFDVNPSSGAYGRMQWLGSRKNALLGQYGSQPGDDQQRAFMVSELRGPESATLARLRSASGERAGY